MTKFKKSPAEFKAGTKPLVEALADEFNFNPEHSFASALPMFKSYRAAQSAHRQKIRMMARAGFLPRYQLTGTVTCFNSSVQRPSIGFQVQASSEIHLKPIQRDATLFKSAS